MRWRILLAGAVVAASGSAVWLGGTPALAAVGNPLVGAASGRCMEVVGDSPTSGAAVAIADCTGRQNQGWVFTSAGELRTFDETRCLDVTGAATAAGTRLIIWDCSGGANQRFRANADATVTATQSGLCVDVEGAGTAAGTPVVIWTCNGQSNQRWSRSGGPTTPPPSTPPPSGPSTCATAPVDPQATAQARRLLCYVVSQYGNHILSGQRESNGRETEFQYIRTNTGKDPAIRGMDMCDRPGSVDRAAAWWNAGGIPMIGWHVGAPNTSNCNYGGTASINATLTAGTAENRFYLNDLDAAATQLLRLQSQGVAVLWVPYHEAGGTWFWWSKEGGAQYQRLWRFQFDYFTRTRGIHNLVWLHGYNGSPQASFYPGKAVVDIGGADTYVTDHGPLTSMFTSTRTIVGGTIPIALHENGAIPDPDQLQSSDTRWVLFHTWNGSWLTERNDPTFLRRVYNHAYVVTRDEVPNLR